MAYNILEADEYIRLNTLDNEDYFDSDDTRKTALLNVSSRTLTNKFGYLLEDGEVIPSEAVYEFASVLAYIFNDTNKLAQQGQASFSIRGISTTFKDWSQRDLSEFIPESVYTILGVSKRSPKWTVM